MIEKRAKNPSTGLDSPQSLSPSEPLGRRRFLQGVGAVAGAGALTAVLPAGRASAAPPTGASVFKPLAKVLRVADTREPGKYQATRVSDRQIRIALHGNYGVPDTASAIVATVTGVNFGDPNFVTVFPSGTTPPVVSNLNMFPGDITANLATVKIGGNGAVDIYSLQPCHMIFDIIGYYEPVTEAVAAGRFVGLANARRAIDTRPNYAASKSITVVDLTPYVPPDASSVVINLTATETTGPTYFTAFGYGEANVPNSSSLNIARADDTRAAAVVVPVENIDGKRRIKVFSLVAAKLIVDVTGYYTGETSSTSDKGLFVPVDPVRILDTRLPGEIGRLWPNWVVEGLVPAPADSEASAIVVNLTMVETRGPGYLTIQPARQPQPPTSNVNATAPLQVIPNHAITTITAKHGYQVFSSHGAHVLVDYAGYFTGSPALPTVAKYINPPPPPAPPPWIIRIPRFGLESFVGEGDAKQVTDSGLTWHWTGTGWMGQVAHVGLFGHRTEHGGPYRNVDWMENGDLFTVTTGDAREYTYRMVRRDITTSNTENILQATRLHPGTTVSIIACTVGFDSSKSAYPNRWAATSLKYRIVVTGELVSWRVV